MEPTLSMPDALLTQEMNDLYRALLLSAADDVIRSFKNPWASDGIAGNRGPAQRLKLRREALDWVHEAGHDSDAAFSFANACESLKRKTANVREAFKVLEHVCGGSVVMSYEASPVDWFEVNSIYRGLNDYLGEKE